jgi:hypothetical protein
MTGTSAKKTPDDLSPVTTIINAIGVASLLPCVPGTNGPVGRARTGRGQEGAIKNNDRRSGRRGGRDGVFCSVILSDCSPSSPPSFLKVVYCLVALPKSCSDHHVNASSWSKWKECLGCCLLVAGRAPFSFTRPLSLLYVVYSIILVPAQTVGLFGH